jgi:predicted NAD/FAD-binding protein
MASIAIIGTGIAGMSCGWFLYPHHEVHVFEELDYAGGHTNTISVQEGDHTVHFDTGFMVYNHITYPLLTKLFDQLGVETIPTSMSFSVQHVPTRLEYCGSGLNGLFAQRKNLIHPPFIRMLLQIVRFNRESVRMLNDPLIHTWSIREFCEQLNLNTDFIFKYLVPMSGAVWSTPPEKMLDFPAHTLIRFFHNHGFLGLHTQHQWYTVKGGSRNYRDRITAPYTDRIRLNDGVVHVERTSDHKVKIKCRSGHEQVFDQAILACHADQALRIIQKPSQLEQRLLSPFNYQLNLATVHTDETIMPQTRRAWSSWNYRISSQNGKEMPTTIYWMNRLQGVSQKQNYFVSINGQEDINPQKIIRQIRYEHPLFDIAAQKAQSELHLLNQDGPVYFCGSYFRYGFHEDALLSAVNLCGQILRKSVL